MLELAARTGGTVRVHPIHLRSPLAAAPAVAQYQIAQTDDGLDVTLALLPSAPAEAVSAEVRATIAAKLNDLGVAPLAIRVRLVPQIARESGAGKLKLVKAARTVTCRSIAV